MGTEGEREPTDSLLRDIVREAATRGTAGEPARTAPLTALRDRASLEALMREVRELIALVPVEEAGSWRTRVETLRGLRGATLQEALGALRTDMEARRLEIDLERATTVPADADPDSPCVMITDRCGHVIASGGDPARLDYYALTWSLQQTVPRLQEGAHLMSHQAGRVGLVVGEHGAVAASFRGRPSGPGMEILARVLTVLEKRHKYALTPKTAEDRLVVVGYVEACRQLLSQPGRPSPAPSPGTGPSGA